MARTLQTIHDSFARRKKDISDVGSDVFIEWMNFIGDFVYDHVKGTDPERFTDTDTTYTVSSLFQSSALPSDFNDESEWENGFYEIDSSSVDTSRRLARTGPGRRDAGYFIKGTNVIFTGIEDSSQFRLRYMPTRTELTALGDFFTIDGLTGGAVLVPDGKLRYLNAALDTLYNIWDDTVGAEGFADQRFVRQLDQLLTHIRKEPDAYCMTDFSSSF